MRFRGSLELNKMLKSNISEIKRWFFMQMRVEKWIVEGAKRPMDEILPLST
jgi:hypothetical protein